MPRKRKKTFRNAFSHLLGHGPALNFSTCAPSSEEYVKVKPIGKILDLYGWFLLVFLIKKHIFSAIGAG
jgi:hypothetical protein